MRPKQGKGVQETGECGRRAGSILCEPASDLGSRELRESSTLVSLEGLKTPHSVTEISTSGHEVKSNQESPGSTVDS